MIWVLSTDIPPPRTTCIFIVTERMRNSIVEGTLAPGMRLSEVEIARRFGVGHGPVRRAIERLLVEHPLGNEPHHSHFGPVRVDRDGTDLYVVTSAVEPAPKILIATRRPGTVGTPGRSADETESATERGDVEAIGRFDSKFYSALVSLGLGDWLQRNCHHVHLRDGALSDRTGGGRCQAPSRLRAPEHLPRCQGWRHERGAGCHRQTPRCPSHGPDQHAARRRPPRAAKGG